jgi:DNA-binding CsgD family transcriptional regulator
MNQATAPSRPLRDGAERLLAGLVPAQTLYTAVCADPSAPLRVSVVGQGGSGKSVLLAALELAYSAAGVSVVGRSAVAAGLAQGADVAVLIDDAHQLDGPELDRLLHLVLTGPVRLVLAYRPWPRKPELDGLEDALSRHHPPVLLGRLDRRGVQNRCTALLGEAPSAETVDLLCEQTGGVPLLIDRVVSSLRTGGRFSGDRVGLPPDVLDRVRHDLNRLAPQLRAMLLAVGLGAAPDVEILADVLALDPVVVADLLSMAQASGLLLDEGGVIPLVRRVMVAGAAPGTKRVTQRLVLATHLERGRPVLELAHQLLDAGARGSDLAAVFESAGDAALSHSSVAHLVRPEPAAAQAVQLYAHAVTAGADPASLAPRRAEASALAGDLDGALRFADQALSDRACADLARAGTVAAAVLAQRGLLARSAEVYRWVGPLRMGSAAPLAALVLLGTGSLTEARTVLAASDGNRPPTLLAGAESLMTTGVLESIVGSPMAAGTTALSTLTQAAALLEPGGRAVLLPDTPAALAAIVALHCGELDVAVSVLERALATGAGGLTARPRCQLLLAWTAMIRGDTALARRWLARTVADTSGLEPREELFAAALAVGLARRESNIPTLQTVWAAAREAIVRHPPNLFALLPLGELAVAAARLQDFDRVAPHLEQARILLERLGDPPLWAAPLHWYGLHAAILREQPGAVEPHATALVKAAKSNHYAAVLAAAGRAWVQVLAGQFDPSEVESAARALQSIGLANDGSRLAGQAAIRSTDRKVMVALLGCARALQATGPGAASSAVDGSIANGVAVGVGPKQGEPMLGGPTHSGTGRAGVVDPPAPVGGSRVAAVPATAPMLSSREREVAELILTGLTYRQIGERLFISAKTVEHHVARMRQRLDVGSRDELFAQLRLFVGASGT